MRYSLDQLRKAKKTLERLSTVSGGIDYQTITINGTTVPERWCPEVTNRVRLRDLPDIASDKVININGGTP
jgi:hypothetical protein